MNANQTIISLNKIREFYNEECEDEGKKFSEKEFKTFVDYCEGDFYQWLEENIKYFRIKQLDERIIREKANFFSALETLMKIKRTSTKVRRDVINLFQKEFINFSIGFVQFQQLIKSKNKFDRVKRNAAVNIGGNFGAQIPEVDIVIYDTQSLNIIAFMLVNQYAQNIANALFHIKKELLKTELMKHILVFYAIPLTEILHSKDEIVILEMTKEYYGNFDSFKKHNKKSFDDLYNLFSEMMLQKNSTEK
jgi:hypothetical protein